MTVNLRHAQSGVLKSAPVGFSWTTLFFSGFPALFRGDLKWAVIMWIVHCSMIVVSIFTLFLASVVAHIAFVAIYNKRYIVELMGQGYEPADDHSRNEMARKGIVVMQGTVALAPQSSWSPHWEADPEPEPAPEPEPVRKASLERQTLAAARARNGVLTAADVSIATECELAPGGLGAAGTCGIALDAERRPSVRVPLALGGEAAGRTGAHDMRKPDMGQALAVLAGLIVGAPIVLLGGPALVAIPLAFGAGITVGYLADRMRRPTR